MSENLQDLFDQLRAETPVTDAGFKAIVARLYAMGIVMREESTSEARLYDDARHIEPLLHSYFGLAGFRLSHNAQFNYFRLYPPGTGTEGDEGEAARRLRARLTKDFAAYVLALRHLYQIAIETGDLNERAERVVSIDDIGSAMAQLLRAELPSLKSSRLEIYRELRSQKLVRLPKNFEDESADMMISIRPCILDFVSETALRSIESQARDRMAAQEADAAASAVAATLHGVNAATPEIAESSDSSADTALEASCSTEPKDFETRGSENEAVPFLFDVVEPEELAPVKPLRIRESSSVSAVSVRGLKKPAKTKTVVRETAKSQRRASVARKAAPRLKTRSNSARRVSARR